MTSSRKSDTGNPLVGLMDQLKELGFTEGDVAERIHYSRQHVNAMKNGKKPLEPYVVKEITVVLNQIKSGIGLKSDSRDSRLSDKSRDPNLELEDRSVGRLKVDCQEHLDAFLESCGNHPDHLGWTKITLQETFPLNKWAQAISHSGKQS